MHKDLAKLVKALDKQGFTTRLTGKGHVTVTKDGQWVTTLAGTPSDWRGWRNAIARLRAAGFVWPSG